MEDFKQYSPPKESEFLTEDDVRRIVTQMDGTDFNASEMRIDKQNGFFGVTLPIVTNLPGTTAQTAANFTTPFFIANRTYEVITVTERHETAGSDAGAVTVQLKKVPSGTAPGSGTSILTTALSLKTTANTNQSGTVSLVITSSIADRVLVAGDALSLLSSGTLTALVGVTVSVLLKAI